jgi:dihydropyrimidinase
LDRPIVEQITCIAEQIKNKEAEVISAENRLVLPGIIDAHVQLEVSYRDTVMTDNFESGSKAAIAGGVTTLIDFADQKKGTTPLKTLEARRKEADRFISTDYSLHFGLTDVNETSLEQIPDIIRSGVPSFKIYMTYSNRGRMVSGGELLEVMRRVKNHNGIVEVHAEDDPVIVYQTEKLLAEGKSKPKYFPESRLPIAERIAINNAIFMSEETGCPLYVHHISTAKGVELVKAAKDKGQQVYGETCPPYLELTEEKYKEADCHLYIVNPPLRTAYDMERLWKAVTEGSIDVIGTDHCSYTREQKSKNKNNFDLIPAGFPGVETLLPYMYTTGVHQGRFKVMKLVELLSANPAKLFGLYPQKGTLQIGSDADLVILDPVAEYKLDPADLFMNVDFHPFEDMMLHGRVECTILRGSVVYLDGQFKHLGKGRFIPARL